MFSRRDLLASGVAGLTLLLDLKESCQRFFTFSEINNEKSIVTKSGDKYWYIGELDLTLPEYERKNKKAYVHGALLHRTNGPAMILADGAEGWCEKGLYHRIDGPALIVPSTMFQTGMNLWYQKGVLHRENGPAIETEFCDDSWYLFGKNMKNSKEAMPFYN